MQCKYALGTREPEASTRELQDLFCHAQSTHFTKAYPYISPFLISSIITALYFSLSTSSLSISKLQRLNLYTKIYTRMYYCHCYLANRTEVVEEACASSVYGNVLYTSQCERSFDHISTWTGLLSRLTLNLKVF